MEVDVATPRGVSKAPDVQLLTRNSSISVTIDDLAEGLLVVSFAHSDNLYQGVLFQLNREGIPSGISFAKENALKNDKDKADGDLSAAQPLHQRHSYNPGSSYGASYSNASQPILRRVIKPPARFKNARMSLRLRARPVLCAKCRTLCDAKSENGEKSKNESSPGEENQTPAEKSKKERLKPTKQDNLPATNLNGKICRTEEAQIPITGVTTDPADLRYESVGSTGVVGSYWKRPLAQPLNPSTEETYSRLRKHKVHTDVKDKPDKKKRIATSTTTSNANAVSTRSSANSIPKSSSSKLNAGSKPAETSIPDTLIKAKNNPPTSGVNTCDNNFPNTRRRKELSLRLCIAKLTELRTVEREKRAKSTTEKSLPQAVRDKRKLPLNSNECSELEKEKVLKSKSKRKSCGSSRKGGHTWGSRMRTKSNVPMRYRDESYLTKDIFNFNKRRPTTDGNEIPVLTICRNEAANSFTLASSSEPMNGVSKSERNNDIAQMPSEVYPQSSVEGTGNASSIISSTTNPSDSSLNSSESAPSFRIKSASSKHPEIVKTPTIKITFGSSGNGMVVQIPPKVAQNVESDSATDLKAARKAMKKAKKEAKRKRSISPSDYPSSLQLQALSPDHSLKLEKSNPSSPVMPSVSTTGSVGETENGSSLSPFLESQPNDHFPPLELIKKKSKKQKKRRRSSKTSKENENLEDGIGSNQDLSESISSSISNSSLNQDCLNYELRPTSPHDVSMKSFGLESISSPSTPEPFQSLCKDTSPIPPRRRSIPPTSSASSDSHPQRVCINLKRIDANAYVPLPSLSSASLDSNEDSAPLDENGMDSEEGSDPGEFAANGRSNGTGDEEESGALTPETLECKKNKEKDHVYHKGDIIWGKQPGLPWWPGKVTEILPNGTEESSARISWYNSSNEATDVRFTMMLPFAEYFDSKYAKGSHKKLYQSAVSAAMDDAELKPDT